MDDKTKIWRLNEYMASPLIGFLSDLGLQYEGAKALSQRRISTLKEFLDLDLEGGKEMRDVPPKTASPLVKVQAAARRFVEAEGWVEEAKERVKYSPQFSRKPKGAAEKPDKRKNGLDLTSPT